MSLAKLRNAVAQAEDMTSRISQLQRVRSLIDAENDASIIPNNLPLERAFLPANSAKTAIDAEIVRLQQKLDALNLKIAEAGAVLL